MLKKSTIDEGQNAAEVHDRGLKLRLNIPDTLIIDQGCLTVWYQTSDDGYVNRVATSKATREAFRKRCEEKFTEDACNPEGWIAVARSLGPGDQEISQLLRKDDLDELLCSLSDPSPSEQGVRSPRVYGNGKVRRKAATAEQPLGPGAFGGLCCPHCLQVYVPPSLDQRFVATCVQEGDGLRCNATVRLYSRRYLGSANEGALSARSRGTRGDEKDAEESRPLQDVRIKTDVRRAASSLITYVEKAHGHRLVGFVAEFVRGLEGRIYLTAVHSAKWAQYISETTGLSSTEHAPAGALATSPRQTLRNLQTPDLPHISSQALKYTDDKTGQRKTSVISDWVKEREREARIADARQESPSDSLRSARNARALASPRDRKDSPRGAALVATAGHHPPPYSAVRQPSPQRGPGNPSTSGSHVSPSKRPQEASGTRFWTYGGRDRKCDADMAATLTEEVEASREQVQHFYQELQATKRRLQESEASLAEQHSVYNAMVRQLTAQFLEAKTGLEAAGREEHALREENARLAADLAGVTKERDELLELLRRERDAAMSAIVEHTEAQKLLKQGEAQLLIELAASRAECASLRKNVDEEKEVVAAVSRQLVEFRERFGSALPARDGAAAAAAAAMAAARRATPAVVLEAPSVDGDQISLYSAAISPRAGGNFITINVEDLLVTEDDGPAQLNAVQKKLAGADEHLKEIYAFYCMLGKSYTDKSRPSMTLLQFGKLVRDIGLLKRQADGPGIAVAPAACDAIFAKVHVPDVLGGESGEPTLTYMEFLEALVRLAAFRYKQPLEQKVGNPRPPHLSKRLALFLEKDIQPKARRRLVTSAEKKQLSVSVPATPLLVSPRRAQASTPVAITLSS
ncbi:hypothetical protein KFL_008110010 [Klebsormidium nitens]|uniref:Uncharacterized protein n=1 Tax=Klebsormidium nitens TaxID=105231 RepID=A0A1Y1ITQ3_KLENI|nr:hypothetical protein KFL_008110010 [Klebsormidium nitens]|eukprot:GAQ91578.1 hypothetical protein KFL_008110010 [Klebsormidium nitens]